MTIPENYAKMINEYDFKDLFSERGRLKKSIQKNETSKEELVSCVEASSDDDCSGEAECLELVRRRLVDKYPKDYLAAISESERRLEIVNLIDRVIKKVWKKNIVNDYTNNNLLREASFNGAFYYHLRRKLSFLMEEYDIRLYPEFYINKLQYRADIAIVQMDFEKDVKDMRDAVKDLLAVLELKYVSGKSQKTIDAVKRDVTKMKDYYKKFPEAQYYCALIYENEVPELRLIDKRSTNNWADGNLTILQADISEGYLWFSVKNNCNHLNMDLD